MLQVPEPLDPTDKKVESGYDILAGFLLGIAVYGGSWVFLFLLSAVVPSRGQGAYFAVAVPFVQLAIFGFMIRKAITGGQTKFSQGLILCLAVLVLLTGACWAVFR